MEYQNQKRSFLTYYQTRKTSKNFKNIYSPRSSNRKVFSLPSIFIGFVLALSLLLVCVLPVILVSNDKACPHLQTPVGANQTIGKTDLHHEGEAVVFTCNEGSALSDFGTIQAFTCLKNGSWDGEPRDCQNISCPALTPPLDTLLVTGQLIDNVAPMAVVFDCKNNTRSLIYVCKESGEWTLPVQGDCYTAPVNGGWGEWSSWSQCCTPGTRTRTRQCDTPPARFGGDTCTPPGTQTEACPTDC